MNKRIPPLAIILWLVAGAASADTSAITAVVHVTSVKREDATDWCTTGSCKATRYTVEASRAAKNPNEVIRYVLKCVEVIDTETLKVTVSCSHVQADEDYNVKIFPDSIAFPGSATPDKDGPVQVSYTIETQREEKK